MGLLKCVHYQLVDDTEENHCVCNSIKSSSSSFIDVIILSTIFFTPDLFKAKQAVQIQYVIAIR